MKFWLPALRARKDYPGPWSHRPPFLFSKISAWKPANAPPICMSWGSRDRVNRSFSNTAYFRTSSQVEAAGWLTPIPTSHRTCLRSWPGNGFFEDARNRERVIYVDPASQNGVIPFNVLAVPYPPYTTAINLVEAFKRTWPESLREAPRFTNVLLAALLTLIANRTDPRRIAPPFD